VRAVLSLVAVEFVRKLAAIRVTLGETGWQWTDPRRQSAGTPAFCESVPVMLMMPREL
jgi:hypothetical protein